MRSSISIVSRGLSAVCCGSVRSFGMGGGGRFSVVVFWWRSLLYLGLGCLLVLRRSGGCGPVCHSC